MKRNSFTFAFALLSTAVIACGGGGGDDDDDDVCAGVSNCSVQGSSCDGDTVVDCQPDVNGCLVESTVDCTTSGEVCDDTGGDAMCVSESCDDVECEGANDGDSFCDGDTTVSCADDGNGCLIATTEDCTTNGDVCDETTGEAVCVPVCTDHPLCAGMGDGDTACNGSFLNTCAVDADGCLQLTQESCSPGLCDDAGDPAVCGTVAETGDTCGDALIVNSSTFLVSGADFTADFTDTETFDDASCGPGEGGAHPDALFQIDLLDGETVVVNELGGIDVVFNLQSTCGGANTCLANQDEPESGFTYTAAGDETIFLAVEPYFDAPTTTDYAIQISIDPVCGNGLVEAGEQCDDAGTDAGDGCSDVCEVEFGFICDTASPTTCTPFQDVGELGDGDSRSISGGALAEGEDVFYTVTFTEDVEITGTLSSSDGDVDLYVFAANGNILNLSAVDGDETFNIALLAGTYALNVNAFVAGSDYSLEVSAATLAAPDFGTFAPEEAITDATGGPVAPPAYAHHTITFSADVLLSGSLDGFTTGDPDLLIYNDQGILALENAVGAETLTDVALPAGTYIFQIMPYAPDGEVDTYTLSLSTTTPPAP